jgi:hypothetical protein
MKLAVSLAVFATACADDPAPSAEIRSVTPEQVMPLDDANDDLTITVRYDDGDGDLGGGVAEVGDCRSAGVTIAEPIPQIAASPGRHITGTLELHLNDIGELAPGVLPRSCADLGVAPLAASTTVFCVILVDAAGHRGAGDCTRPIAVVQP